MSDEVQRLTRTSVHELDEILGTPFKVLDEGFVRVVDYMGSDESIVQAARVSYGKGTKRLSGDRLLIRFLMRNMHTTPFEMCEIKLHVRAPMDCWRQWIRHRTASVNEYSTRYSEAIDATQKTLPGDWRKQSNNNRQGSAGTLNPKLGEQLTNAEAEFHRAGRDLYRQRLDLGVARELARKDLPLSTYTEAYWKIDLHNLFHFLLLRMSPHAQHEIRSYATVIGQEIVARWCPVAWEAFVDYRQSSETLSRLEAEIVRSLAQGRTAEASELATAGGILTKEGNVKTRSRERDELEQKLLRLGFKIPWDDLSTKTLP